MKAKFDQCENCEGLGTIGEYDCSWCLGYGDIPDFKTNEQTAALDAAQSLGQLIHSPNFDNEMALAKAMVIYGRAVRQVRDPWNESL